MSYLEKHTAFSRIANNYSIKNVDIDPRLIESFKRVLSKIQKYFNEQGYSSLINYAELLDEFMLSKSDTKLKIEVSNEPRKIGASGFYRISENKIVIDESLLDNQDKVDHTLCHEFTHFLVHTREKKNEEKDIYIMFVDEALTEMLTSQIFPGFNSYEPQVKMISFANVLQNKKNNYKSFLQGNFNTNNQNEKWIDFLKKVNKYQSIYNKNNQILVAAQEEETYIDAQRTLIEMMNYKTTISSFIDYEEIVRKLSLRPALDTEWMDKYYDTLDNELLKKLSINNTEERTYYLEKMKEFRKVSEEIAELSKDYKVIITLGGKKFQAQIYGKKFITTPYIGISSIGYDGRYYIFTKDGETVKVSAEEFDYEKKTEERLKKRRELLDKQEELASVFRGIKNLDISYLKSIKDKEKLLRLERFVMPSIDGKHINNNVYLAIYEDRIELLGYGIVEGQLHNVLLKEHRGNLEDGTVNLRSLESCEDAIICTNESSNRIRNKLINHIIALFTKNLTAEQMEVLIDVYKNTHTGYENDSPEEIKEEAIWSHAEDILNKLSDEERIKLTKKVMGDTRKIVITSREGNIDVGVLYSNNISVVGRKTVLYDKTKNAPFNELIHIVGEGKNQTINCSSPIKINTDGSLAIDLDEKITYLREEYKKLALQVEYLMKMNTIKPVENYEGRLSYLQEKRDELDKQASISF